MRVIIAGGGTGGHVIPALAIARELQDLYSAEVQFIGTARGIENRPVIADVSQVILKARLIIPPALVFLLLLVSAEYPHFLEGLVYEALQNGGAKGPSSPGDQ